MLTTQEILTRAKSASSELARLSPEIKNAALLKMADELERRSAEILQANAQDVEAATATLGAVMIDRLRLDEKRIAGMAQGIREVAALPDPIGEILEETTLPNGLQVKKIRVPLGVVGIIYDRHPAGVMLKEIADELKLTPGAISQTVDVLVRENIVERTVSPSDRRAILLRATEAGLQLKEQHSQQVENVMQTISKDISSEEFAVFASVLDRLLKQMDALQSQNNK